MFERIQKALGKRWTAAREAPLWRKGLVALTPVWGFGGLLAYGLTSGMDGSAPVWAMCWLGSVSLALWGYAAWLGVRWAIHR